MKNPFKKHGRSGTLEETWEELFGVADRELLERMVDSSLTTKPLELAPLEFEREELEGPAKLLSKAEKLVDKLEYDRFKVEIYGKMFNSARESRLTGRQKKYFKLMEDLAWRDRPAHATGPVREFALAKAEAGLWDNLEKENNHLFVKGSDIVALTLLSLKALRQGRFDVINNLYTTYTDHDESEDKAQHMVMICAVARKTGKSSSEFFPQQEYQTAQNLFFDGIDDDREVWADELALLIKAKSMDIDLSEAEKKETKALTNSFFSVMGEESISDKASAALIHAMAYCGDYKNALHHDQQHKTKKYSQYSFIAGQMARGGHVDKVENLVKKSPLSRNPSDDLLRNVVEGFADAGLFNEARIYLDMIKYTKRKASASEYLVERLIEQGEPYAQELGHIENNQSTGAVMEIKRLIELYLFRQKNNIAQTIPENRIRKLVDDEATATEILNNAETLTPKMLDKILDALGDRATVQGTDIYPNKLRQKLVNAYDANSQWQQAEDTIATIDDERSRDDSLLDHLKALCEAAKPKK